MPKTLHYDFINTPSLEGHVGPDLSITRATTATVVDADGYIREVQAGEARFTGATFSHNQLKYSNTFSNAAWAKNANTNVSAESSVANPVDDSGSWKLYSSDGTSAGGLRQDWGSDSAGQTYLISIYAKPQNYSWLQIATYDQVADGIRVWFNLSTGEVGSTSIIGSGITLRETGIEDAGDGWYRCWVVVDNDGTDPRCQPYFYPSNADGVVTNGNASGDGIYIAATHMENVSGTNYTPSDYIPTTSAAKTVFSGPSTKGLLVEEARTNICLQSEDLSTTWVNEFSVDTQNAAVAPDGSLTANRLVDDSSTGTGNVDIYQSLTLTAATEYTVSAYAKQDQLPAFRLAIVAMGALDVAANFDVSDGTIGSTGADNTTQSIEDVGNGWYRCSVTFTSDATDTSVLLVLYVLETKTSSTSVTNRDGTSSIFLWGAQLEAGAFPTSYIPTTTGSVTRNVDAITLSDVSWLAPAGDAMSIYVKGDIIVGASDLQVCSLFTLGDGASDDDRILVYVTGVLATSGTLVDNDNVTQASLQIANVWDDGAQHTISTRIAANDFRMYSDGTASTLDSSGSVPNELTTVGIGSYPGAAGTNPTNGHLAEIAYWAETFPDVQLNAISQGFVAPIKTPLDAIPKDTKVYRDFISTYITPIGDLQRDYRNALVVAGGDTEANANHYSLNDAFKKWYESL